MTKIKDEWIVAAQWLDIFGFLSFWIIFCGLRVGYGLKTTGGFIFVSNRCLAMTRLSSNIWKNALPRTIGILLEDKYFWICVDLWQGCRLCFQHRYVCGDTVLEDGVQGLSCSKSAFMNSPYPMERSFVVLVGLLVLSPFLHFNNLGDNAFYRRTYWFENIKSSSTLYEFQTTCISNEHESTWIE